jgi:porphobilinogen synthase
MTVLDPRLRLPVRDGSVTASPVPGQVDPRGRPRVLRSSRAMRTLVRETRLSPSQLVAPMFVHAPREPRPIPGLPGLARLGWRDAVAEARHLAALGVGGVMLFGVPPGKDPAGAGAADPQGPVPVALRALREEGLPLVLAADVCLCAYTSHGHCGVLDGDRVANDASLPRLVEAALAYVEAGADVVAPSAMMDGQVGAIRAALASVGREDAAILAYAAKHASSLYGPFRDAADSSPAFGDRRSYQLDPANGREAMRELALDAAEGADILMVKPAITNLDVLVRARQRFDLPLAAYQVSGEVAMLDAGAAAGHLDRRAAALEMVTAIARAGADIILTYLAADLAGWLDEARS